jgi:hypothetical protein
MVIKKQHIITLDGETPFTGRMIERGGTEYVVLAGRRVSMALAHPPKKASIKSSPRQRDATSVDRALHDQKYSEFDYTAVK